MQITPVNNTNFNGQFKKNPVLRSLLSVSSKTTLGRFNEVLERAAKVDDGFIYQISCSKIKSPISYTKTFTFLLNKEDTKYKYETIEKKAERSVNYCDDRTSILERFSGVLSDFLPYLEKEYPKFDFDETHSELIEKINSKLI